jgi:toxin ParE1/3/4
MYFWLTSVPATVPKGELHVSLTPLARADLNGIWEYTASQWSNEQADLYIRSLDSAFRQLCISPLIGKRLEVIDPPVRVFPFRSHVIIYMPGETNLNVLRVVHQRSNWAALFAE